MADFDHIVSRTYYPSAEMCCDRCAFGEGEHATWCAMRPVRCANEYFDQDRSVLSQDMMAAVARQGQNAPMPSKLKRFARRSKRFKTFHQN